MEYPEFSDEYIEELVTKELESMHIDIEDLESDDTENDLHLTEQNLQLNSNKNANFDIDEDDENDSDVEVY